MKVIKLKNGYSIRCSNSEYEALVHMISKGPNALQRACHADLSNGAKTALRREPFTLFSPGPLTVTDDRRGD